MSSKQNNNQGGLTPAEVVDAVFDLHRRSHHFSIKKQKPELFESILKEIEKLPGPVVLEAYNVYIKASQKDGKKPHPNYFLGICKRVKEDYGETNKWSKTL